MRPPRWAVDPDGEIERLRQEDARATTYGNGCADVLGIVATIVALLLAVRMLVVGLC